MKTNKICVYSLYDGQRPASEGGWHWCPVCGEWGYASMYSDSCTACANAVGAHLAKTQEDYDRVYHALRARQMRIGRVKEPVDAEPLIYT